MWYHEMTNMLYYFFIPRARFTPGVVKGLTSLQSPGLANLCSEETRARQADMENKGTRQKSLASIDFQQFFSTLNRGNKAGLPYTPSRRSPVEGRRCAKNAAEGGSFKHHSQTPIYGKMQLSFQTLVKDAHSWQSRYKSLDTCCKGLWCPPAS